MHSRSCRAFISITLAMLLGSGPSLAASNACKADLNGDLVVNFVDLAVLKSVFFQRCSDPGPTCGDGVAQGPPEQCDDGNLLDGDGCSATCAIEPPLLVGDGLLATGQTTCWNAEGSVAPCAGTGQDGELTKGAPLAYVDNGDGTITDTNTSLMWEKLDDSNLGGFLCGPHDWDCTYMWDSAFAEKLALLNRSGGFAGHKDWRLPNLNELESIRNLQNVNPAVSNAFDTGCAPGCTVLTCSCTKSDFYWSSSSDADFPEGAWAVFFDDGFVFTSSKAEENYVRAVRGGP